jgi:Mycobacterium membrane protein
MNRPPSPWSTGSVTDRFDDRTDLLDDEYDEYEDDDVEDSDEYADYGENDVQFYTEHDDRQWLWVASVAGTLMILSGGDSGTTAGTISSSTSEAAPYPSAAPSPSASRPPSATALPRETITSVTPTPTATAAAPTTEPTDAPPPPAGDPRTVTYTVTGNRQFLDLVTVIYTDAQGALQTDVNVALPWTKQVTLDPGVQLSSVTATSVGGQLNCSITDGSGATLVSQTNSTLITNCTR